MRNSDVLSEIVRQWGVQKVMQTLVALLRKQNKSENLLADDLEKALEAYNKRASK